MPDQPFLVLPSARREPRPRPRSFPGGAPRMPAGARQRTRIAPRIRELETQFARHQASLQVDAGGASFEEVVVLETAGTVDNFVRAVRNTPGMEWLVESDEFEVDADDDFGRDEDHPDEPLQARLFLVLAEQRAIAQLRQLWLLYSRMVRGEVVAFPRGQAVWRELFAHLRDVRLWNVNDRMSDSGLAEIWSERIAEGSETVRMEVELWYRQSAARRQAARDAVGQVISSAGGSIVSSVDLPDISYHALLAEIPIAAASPILAREETRLISDTEIMFVRPVGQFAVARREEEPALDAADLVVAAPETPEPLVALLDGLPLANHVLIRSHLIVDDPDNYSAAYGAGEQHHGTAMASLVVHGDLHEALAASPRPVYVRPIMKPNPNRLDRAETIPEDVLPVDLLHRAVRRMMEGDGDDEPTATTVRIINYSIGNPFRRFQYTPSPLARLLDWLSWKYQVLFVASAGNCLDTLETGLSDTYATPIVGDDALRIAVIQAIWREARNRRIMEPAEAINALTVGARYADATPTASHRGLVLFDDTFPSPVNSLGHGFRRSVKPDVLAAGGRTALKRAGLAGDPDLRLDTISGGYAPGQEVASPGPTPGDVRFRTHTTGTSNASALTSRTASAIYDALSDTASITTVVPATHLTAVTKSLLVHSARWPTSHPFISDALRPLLPARANIRQTLARFLGYGCIDAARTVSATDQRATMLGWGTLRADDSDIFEVPLPPSLSAQAIWRRLTITLAWLTPVNARHRNYRRASLWVEPNPANSDPLGVSRAEADYRMARRGTVQHEVLEGTRATAYADGDLLRLRVACRADCDVLEDEIPYGLCVSVEVAEPVAIYQEIRDRIRDLVQVTATAD